MKNMWQIYYLEDGKSLRQFLTIEAEFMHEAYALAEKQLAARDVMFLATIKLPLKLAPGEM